MEMFVYADGSCSRVIKRSSEFRINDFRNKKLMENFDLKNDLMCRKPYNQEYSAWMFCKTTYFVSVERMLTNASFAKQNWHDILCSE